jgi:monofunctional glycosyltransferase
MTVAKRRNGRRGALGLTALAAVWLLGVWPPPVWWRDHWPRCTAMMRLRMADGRTGGPADGSSRSDCPPFRPSALREVSPLLQRMVIIGEDSRFRTHHGIDPAEIGDALQLDRRAGVWGTLAAAWRQRDRLRGASTITQQLAKNLYLSPSRSPLRKLKEAVTALRLELALPKDRILELYLDVVELGPGVWGVDAASRQYFGVPPAQLDETQAAALAATLPHPRTSNPAFHPARMLARRDLILARYHGANVYIPPEEELDSLLAVPTIAPPALPPLPDTIIVPPFPDSTRDTVVRDTTARRDTTP